MTIMRPKNKTKYVPGTNKTFLELASADQMCVCKVCGSLVHKSSLHYIKPNQKQGYYRACLACRERVKTNTMELALLHESTLPYYSNDITWLDDSGFILVPTPAGTSVGDHGARYDYYTYDQAVRMVRSGEYCILGENQLMLRSTRRSFVAYVLQENNFRCYSCGGLADGVSLRDNDAQPRACCTVCGSRAAGRVHGLEVRLSPVYHKVTNSGLSPVNLDMSGLTMHKVKQGLDCAVPPEPSFAPVVYSAGMRVPLGTRLPKGLARCSWCEKAKELRSFKGSICRSCFYYDSLLTSKDGSYPELSAKRPSANSYEAVWLDQLADNPRRMMALPCVEGSEGVKRAKQSVCFYAISKKGSRWGWMQVPRRIAILLIEEGFGLALQDYPNFIVVEYSQEYRVFRKQILDRDKHTYHYCGGVGTTIDHIKPISRLGYTSPNNCVAACEVCNKEKAGSVDNIYVD